MEFPKGYIQEKQEFRTNEAERKLYYYLRSFFTYAIHKVVSGVYYYVFNKETLHSTDQFQVGKSIQISNYGIGQVSYLNLLKTSGTESAVGPTPTGSMGAINAYGYDGTNYRVGASVEFLATEPYGATTGGTYINFRTTPTGSATPINSGFISDSGSWASGKGSLSTTATTGFLYVPTCAGVPTGVPESVSGRVAMVVDSSAGKAYIYSGGWQVLN